MTVNWGATPAVRSHRPGPANSGHAGSDLAFPKADVHNAWRVALLRVLPLIDDRARLRPTAPGMRCRTGFPTLQHFHQRDK